MINVKQWMLIPYKIRTQIANVFNLKKSGRVGVSNNIIISDGYTQDDLLKLNLTNLQILMDSSVESFDELFDEYKTLIKKSFEYIEVIDENIPTPEPTVEISTEEIINKNIAPSGDTETYFGTKIKPVTYKPNVKKETNKRR